ncbi:hypothetical protein T6N54_004911 [Escherichia coli]|nr:hypothetical protein [Escherichia coli]
MSELNANKLIRELATVIDRAAVEVDGNDWCYDTDAFLDMASPENIKLLLAHVAKLERDCAAQQLRADAHDRRADELATENDKLRLQLSSLTTEICAADAAAVGWRQRALELQSRTLRVNVAGRIVDDICQLAVLGDVDKIRKLLISGIECEILG